MDGIREYYAKWNNPDREGQTYTVYMVYLYIDTYMHTTTYI